MKAIFPDLVLGTCVAAAMSTMVWAHHSTAAYDYAKNMPLQGTVKEFQWTNPHMFIQLLVHDAQGANQEWNIECGTPNINVRHGWKRTDLKPGDKVNAKIHPMHDPGVLGGTLMTVTLSDGRTLFAPGNDIVATPAGAPGAPPPSGSSPQ